MEIIPALPVHSYTHLAVTRWFLSTNVNQQLSQAYIKELDRLQTLDIITKDDFHKGKWKPRKNMCATVSSINKTSLNWGGARSAQRALILWMHCECISVAVKFGAVCRPWPICLRLLCTKHKIGISAGPSLLCSMAYKIFSRRKVGISFNTSNLNF